MAIRTVFIMEKISAGYALERIPDCLTIRASFIMKWSPIFGQVAKV